MTSFLSIVEGIDKSGIATPALFIYSNEDAVVVPKVTATVAQQWGGPTKTVIVTSSEDTYNHVIAGDIMSPGNNFLAVQAIVSWIKQLQ